MSHKIEYNGRSLTAWKTSLHGHTKVSDGALSPQEAIARYAEAGFDAMNFSDHHQTNPVHTYDGMGMTLISGAELHPMGPRNILWHLLAINVPEGFPGTWETAEQAVRAVNEAGGLVYIAHPYWCGLLTEELLPIAKMDGVLGCEIFNTCCGTICKEDSSPYVDALLDLGVPVNIIAVDDSHGAWQFGYNWTMIIAEDKSTASLTQALRDGACYASQGPEFYSISFQDGIFEAEFSPVAQASVISERGSGNYFSGTEPEMWRQDHITSLRLDLNRYPNKRYFRCRIKDAMGRYAWTNPICLKKDKLAL